MKTVAYHGTNMRFDVFDRTKARIQNDLYGGGVAYFTDSLDIAKSYARTMSKKEGLPLVYKCELSLRNTFNVNDNFTGNNLTSFFNDSDAEEFARGARMLSLGANRIQTLSELKSGKPVLNGEQVFRGLSKGMQQTAKARKHLEKLGYDSLIYNGGMMGITSVKHNVFLVYDPSNIKIIQRYVVKASNDDAKGNPDFKFI